ncbi:hypothetical protein GIB67_003524 [Kingdonia uniflora]|uniref:DNA-binding protein RHL1 n=1 Tax=Kingdonia uniflora TaxID=39325 RepID=A0A7J7MF06_9MAGN|nr:hypothetical protein GIB67_003524 [Kingdonia uniflora]
MVRAPKKSEIAPNPETTERNRLKKLAISKNLVSQTQSKPSSFLNPSKTLLKHRGCDILKKSQRKNRFLFSFPGLLGPIEGGKIGELKDLGTKNPILYLDFPQGQMKLFGTIVYPENRYLALQFSKGGKNVVCEDYLDNMIVFSDAWWIGRKEENPEEVRLEIPKELTEGNHKDYDFKGGAGATDEEKPVLNKSGKECELPSPKTDTEDDLSEDSNSLNEKNVKDSMGVTPIRHSARTAGRTFNFAEASPENDSVEIDGDISKVDKKGNVEKFNAEADQLNLEIHAIDSIDVSRIDTPGENKVSDLLVKKPKEFSLCKRAPLIQATLSSLFEKMEEKNSKGSLRKSPMSKVSTPKPKGNGTKRSIDIAEAEGSKNKRRLTKERKPGTQTLTKRKQSQGEDDDIEEFSSESEDIDESDEDWAA